MDEGGVKIRQGVTPTNIEKLDSGRLIVTYSDGESDEFDTVVAAVGEINILYYYGIFGFLTLIITIKSKTRAHRFWN